MWGPRAAEAPSGAESPRRSGECAGAPLRPPRPASDTDADEALTNGRGRWTGRAEGCESALSGIGMGRGCPYCIGGSGGGGSGGGRGGEGEASSTTEAPWGGTGAASTRASPVPAEGRGGGGGAGVASTAAEASPTEAGGGSGEAAHISSGAPATARRGPAASGGDGATPSTLAGGVSPVAALSCERYRSAALDAAAGARLGE